MPLKRLKEEYLEQDGVRFLMEDEAGSTVACRVSHEALRDHADRMHFSGTDGLLRNLDANDDPGLCPSNPDFMREAAETIGRRPQNVRVMR